MKRKEHKIRKSTSRGTPSYQLGHYEMSGEKGKRRSVFKVDVHLGQHSTTEDAMQAWEREIGELQTTRPKQAQKLQAKLDRLRQLTREDS